METVFTLSMVAEVERQAGNLERPASCSAGPGSGWTRCR